MRIDALAWLTAAVLLLTGGVLGLVVIRRQQFWLFSILPAAGLVSVLAGLVWRAWQVGALPGSTAADALALLAGGTLVMTAWMGYRWAASAMSQERPAAAALALIGAGLLAVAAAILAWRGPAPAAPLLARVWLFGLRGVLASVGLGGWLPVLAVSAIGRVQALRAPAAVAELPHIKIAARISADPGRAAALSSYPWLTAAGLTGVAWNLVAHVMPVRAVPGDLWLIVSWLLGGIYLHATSSWRPLRLPAWLATALAALTLAAAVLAALSTGTVL